MSIKYLLAASALAVAPGAFAQTLTTNPAYTPYSATTSRYEPAPVDPNVATRYEVERSTTVSNPYTGASTTTTTTVAPAAIVTPAYPTPAYTVAPQTLDQQWQTRNPPSTQSPYAATEAGSPAPAPVVPYNEPHLLGSAMTSPATVPPTDNHQTMSWDQDGSDVGPNDALYVSGGVGTADRERFKAIAGNYNVKVQMSTASGEFVSDVDFKVTDVKSGALVFETSTNGPLVMAKLQPGKYRVDATKYGATKTQTVTVGASGTKNINLFWNNA